MPRQHPPAGGRLLDVKRQDLTGAHHSNVNTGSRKRSRRMRLKHGCCALLIRIRLHTCSKRCQLLSRLLVNGLESGCITLCTDGLNQGDVSRTQPVQR